MQSLQDPPPPPLAADVALGALECQTATENICVAASQILTLIRTLRLSILLMDDETMHAEECLQVEETRNQTRAFDTESIQLQQQLLQLRQEQLRLGGEQEEK